MKFVDRREVLDRIDDVVEKLPEWPVSIHTTATMGCWLIGFFPWYAVFISRTEVTAPIAVGLGIWTAVAAERLHLIERTSYLVRRKLRDLDYWLARQLPEKSEQEVEVV